ncbi:MAG: M43 family zinc metalloprotease [Bacteroidota bacterium]
MRKAIVLVLWGMSFLTPTLAQFTYEKCGTELLWQQNSTTWPELVDRRADLETFTQNWINQTDRVSLRDQVTIPVVVHVLWNEPVQNISRLQILSQIDILNEDFRMLNDNVRQIPLEFQELAADVGIEFCLASLDPNGNPTDGIVRTQTDYPCIGDFNTTTEFGTPRLFYSELGGSSTWAPDRYLNVWVAPTCNAFLGFGFYPGQSINSEEDGIVVDNRYFGNVCNDGRQHHLGRTATHEVGHYFNLNHVWGRRGCEAEDDGVSDTPPQEKAYNGCPNHPQVSCGSNDMFMNFMDYSDDACIALFTEGQKMRMLAALHGPRAGLLTSNGCLLANSQPRDLSITIFPNPTNDCIHIDFNANFDGMIWVNLFDASGKRHYEARNNASNIRSIDASQLTEGIYFLHLSNNKTTITEKVYIRK